MKALLTLFAAMTVLLVGCHHGHHHHHHNKGPVLTAPVYSNKPQPTGHKAPRGPKVPRPAPNFKPVPPPPHP